MLKAGLDRYSMILDSFFNPDNAFHLIIKATTLVPKGRDTGFTMI